MSVRPLEIEIDDCVAVVDSPRADYIREGSSALGWLILYQTPLAFLRPDERALFCDVPLARYLPEAIPLSRVLAQLP